MAITPSTPLDADKYINLETFRKDGSGVKTPVWAAALDGKLVVMTDGTSYKVKRLRNNPKVRAAGCDARGTVHGPWYEGTGTILDEAGGARADAALQAKYGLIYRATSLVSKLAGRFQRRAYLEITLAAAR
jgi:PPOX class probable F420-dependent enzyme